MNTNQSIIIAMAGASLFAISQAMAQDPSPISVTGATNGDLLLCFRNVSDTGAADVVVDLGPVTTFLATASSIGTTIVLDSGASPANSAYTPLFSIDELTSSAGLNGLPGSDSLIGFSALAVCASNNTVYQTRVDCTAPQQPSPSKGDTAATAISEIGLGASGGELGELTLVTALGGTDPIVAVPSANQFSYQSEGETSPSVYNEITLGGSQNINGINGPLENITDGSTTNYSAFWKVPVRGNGSDTYLGYFTFQADGEIDFTPANAISTPPSPTIALSPDGTLATVAWPNVGLFTVQTNNFSDGFIDPTNWLTCSSLVSTGYSSNSVGVTPVTGNLFFRLVNP
jgi:hypothetical protein